VVEAESSVVARAIEATTVRKIDVQRLQHIRDALDVRLYNANHAFVSFFPGE
jgi:hypothetical protein